MPEEKLNLYYLKKIEYDIDSRLRKKTKKLQNVEKNMGELEILYEDEALLVCKKPAGVATQTKRLGQKDMESLLKNYRASKCHI